ncbi:MAG: YgeY family selenium metabolism-linked hydrolase [Caldilineaceae bacterium]|nr:YgeY family selenium metabolism-linked hydrolase [Caldilineaceae bacterium]
MINPQKMVEFAQAMVQHPSLSGEENAVAARVQLEMTALGFDHVLMDEVGNVVGVVEGAQPGKTLLFDAHTDTVGVTSAVPWQRDPFCADIVEGSLFGRGAADMKGALAAMVHAAGAMDRRQLCGRVVVSASTMEEVLEGVALRVVMERFPPDFVVIGEATGLNLARGGRGRAEVHLETLGLPSHSSAPHLGHNAVLDMAPLILAIDDIVLPEDPLMGPAILALTDIISDPYPGNSVIPSICRATYDRRLLPGESAADVLEAITSLPAAIDIRLNARIAHGEYSAFTGKRLGCEKFFPAWLFPEDEWLVQRALHALHGIGHAPRLSTYRFCTNAAYSAGIAGIPTIGFGPATEHDAHVIDERLKLDDLFAAAAGYQAIIDSVLGEAA